MNTAATVLVTGNTFPVKEALKLLGGRWDSDAKGWRVPAVNSAAARAMVGTVTRTARPTVAPVSTFRAAPRGPFGRCHRHDEDGDGSCGCGREGCGE